MKKKVLFIDRDGTIIREPIGCQVDSYQKLQFLKGAISALKTIVSWNEYELVLVTNQDGLGTAAFPYEDFIGPHQLMVDILESEGVVFSEECIDRSFPDENSPNRKPRTGMLTKYLSDLYDLEHSFVIGDRWTDVELAKNLGCKAFLLQTQEIDVSGELQFSKEELEKVLLRRVTNWEDLLADLRLGVRKVEIRKTTAETDCSLILDLDGIGISKIDTGIDFFDHMLDQLARHGQLDLELSMNGDLNIDEHHTIEDTALALGLAMDQALGSKKGIERYGFCLPMDDCFATCAIDFGGRPELIWDVELKREYLGKLPTEMVKHFFKSFCFTARCNIYIQATGENEHHKIESIFKAFAKAILMAKGRSGNWDLLPTTKNEL
ncbi:bifunctional histidinol-phosphatase/imidazoleglycerol-phosphate dehydratase HisB [Fluviicola chungangensis]|uniref:Histidine biosynthesis bifunctional protein HisB n=1 Tax=Fluviicola chungangensis TaxID=2597671 RepID=A0A556N6L0_9FLAO|nr:bifunctional histidinol-phosphatase/imidazoleglycerol-phosphate dehydratase HisB [Fluviicola chungangensis]TSJ47807.1 bifunctional histidinol-phosphatase/imidazoleglycerol-phosphate dehydratase HisB [Fluviicola chungangensis]